MKTAYPKVNTPVKIYLFSNIPFDNTYKNHCLISKKFTYNGNNISNVVDPEILKTYFLYRIHCYPIFQL